MSGSSSIYMGKNPAYSPFTVGGTQMARTGPYAEGLGKRPSVSEDRMVSYGDAQNMPLSWSSKEISKFVNSGILYKIPGFSSNMGMPEVMSAWDDALKASYAFSQSGGKKWTPWDVIDSYKTGTGGYGEVKQGDWMVDAATGAKIKYVGPRSKTQVDKHVDLSSAEDVQAITTNALTQLLGRAPTEKEVAQYKATINGYEKAHPQVTTTTQQINAQGEAGGTSSTTTSTAHRWHDGKMVGLWVAVSEVDGSGNDEDLPVQWAVLISSTSGLSLMRPLSASPTGTPEPPI